MLEITDEYLEIAVSVKLGLFQNTNWQLAKTIFGAKTANVIKRMICRTHE